MQAVSGRDVDLNAGFGLDQNLYRSKIEQRKAACFVVFHEHIEVAVGAAFIARAGAVNIERRRPFGSKGI